MDMNKIIIENFESYTITIPKILEKTEFVEKIADRGELGDRSLFEYKIDYFFKLYLIFLFS